MRPVQAFLPQAQISPVPGAQSVDFERLVKLVRRFASESKGFSADITYVFGVGTRAVPGEVGAPCRRVQRMLSKMDFLPGL